MHADEESDFQNFLPQILGFFGYPLAIEIFIVPDLR